MNQAWLRIVLLTAGIAAMAVGGAMEAVRWLDTFSGEICIGVGRDERVALREPETNRVPFSLGRTPVLRNTPLESIPFQTPSVSADNLDDSKKYDALVLPFSIRLKRAMPLGGGKSHDELRITEPEGERTVEIAPGKTVELDGVTYQLEAIRPWSGLIRESSGTPMALIALRKGEEAWTEGIFLMADAWRRVEPSIGLRLQWSGSEEAANATVDIGLPGIESARWGVVDGNAMNWFESFAPNDGAELANGTTIHLLRVDEQHAGPSSPRPAIEVEWTEAGQTRQEWVNANTADNAASVRFEYPARLDTVLLICAISEQRALLAMYDHGKLLGRETIPTGSSWKPAAATFEVRLDQALERAVAVPASETKLFEAVLKSPSGIFRAREGEAARQGDALVQLVRRTRPPDVKYELAIIGKDPKHERPLTLGPGDTVRYDNCRLSLASPCAEPLRTAVLHVEYAPSRAWPRLLLAAALALLVWVAMHPSRPATAIDIRSIRTS